MNEIHKNVPKGTLFIVILGGADTSQIRRSVEGFLFLVRFIFSFVRQFLNDLFWAVRTNGVPRSTNF